MESVETVTKLRIVIDPVETGGRLEYLNLSEYFILLPSFVKIDQTVLDGVGKRCIDHRQVGEKCSQIRNRTLNRIALENKIKRELIYYFEKLF